MNVSESIEIILLTTRFARFGLRLPDARLRFGVLIASRSSTSIRPNGTNGPAFAGIAPQIVHRSFFRALSTFREGWPSHMNAPIVAVWAPRSERRAANYGGVRYGKTDHMLVFHCNSVVIPARGRCLWDPLTHPCGGASCTLLGTWVEHWCLRPPMAPPACTQIHDNNMSLL
jgi:hypothetical protein